MFTLCKIPTTSFKQSLRCRRTHWAGFTILEMLISAMLLAVGVSATLSAFTMALNADTDIERSTVALSLAQGEMELIKDSGSWDAINSFASPRISLGGDFSGFDKEIRIDGDPKKVEVIIYWAGHGVGRTVKLATLFTDYNLN